MRAFIGQFDQVSLALFGLGAAIGAVWLVALDLGVLLAAVTLVIGAVVLITRHRWIEIGLLMVGIGIVVSIGYAILGPPPEPTPPVVDPDLPPAITFIPAEVFAQGMAGLLLAGGLLFIVVIGAWDMAEGRRRERLEARHLARRERRLAGD